MKTTIFWFRRDLRLEDNTALYEALCQGKNVLPLFIFDEDILNELPKDDARVQFIYQSLDRINQKLLQHNSSLLILKGTPEAIWPKLISSYEIESVYVNKDYEPYAIKRDLDLKQLLLDHGVEFHAFKDQVIHEESEVMKADGTPYTVFTPYKNKWLSLYKPTALKAEIGFENFSSKQHTFPSMESLGFIKSNIMVKDYDLKVLDNS